MRLYIFIWFSVSAIFINCGKKHSDSTGTTDKRPIHNEEDKERIQKKCAIQKDLFLDGWKISTNINISNLSDKADLTTIKEVNFRLIPEVQEGEQCTGGVFLLKKNLSLEYNEIKFAGLFDPDSALRPSLSINEELDDLFDRIAVLNMNGLFIQKQAMIIFMKSLGFSDFDNESGFIEMIKFCHDSDCDILKHWYYWYPDIDRVEENSSAYQLKKVELREEKYLGTALFDNKRVQITISDTVVE